MLKVDGLCRRLDRQTERVLRELSAWDAPQLKFKPEVEAWSALEVLSHLCKSEAGLARDLQPSCAAPASPPTPAETLRAHGLIRWLLKDGKVQVPQSVAGVIWPDDALSFEDVARDWRAARELLVTVARDSAAHDSASGEGSVFRHPGSGAMTLAHTLRFVYAHARHHQHQLARLQDAFDSNESLQR